MRSLLSSIIAEPSLHARWLNALSYMENEGARLMAACEHPTLVKEQMLKHAAEEFRHAYYLKNQIGKVWKDGLSGYRVDELFGGYHALHYMKKLNVGVSRLLKRHGYLAAGLRGAAYTLVSYAIEVRAHDVYPEYQEELVRQRSRVSVRNIIIEEAEHLEEMTAALAELDDGEVLSAEACAIERTLWNSFSEAVQLTLENTGSMTLLLHS